MAAAVARRIWAQEGARRIAGVFQSNISLKETCARPDFRFSNIAGRSESNRTEAPADPTVYYGNLSSMLRGVKLLSASTFLISLVGTPFLTFFTNPELSVLAKGSLSSLMVGICGSTTFALHWIASPYVHKLVWVPGSDTIDVQTLSWMAIVTKRRIKLSDVKAPETQRPLVSFAANDRYYFVDRDEFPIKELVDLLCPKREAEPSESYYESDWES